MARKTTPEAEAVYLLTQRAYLDAKEEQTTGYAVAKAQVDRRVEGMFLSVGKLIDTALKQPGATKAALIEFMNLSAPTIDKYLNRYRESAEFEAEAAITEAGGAVTFSIERGGSGFEVLRLERGGEVVRVTDVEYAFSPEGDPGLAMQTDKPGWVTIDLLREAQRETGFEVYGMPEEETSDGGEW